MKYIQTLLLSLLIGYTVVGQEWNSTGNNTTTGTTTSKTFVMSNTDTNLLIYRDNDVGNWSLLRSNLGSGIGLIGQPDFVALSVLRSNSYVGIHTKNPKSPLSIGYNAGNNQLGFQRADGAENFQIGVTSTNGALFRNSSGGGDFDFQTNVGGSGMKSVLFVEGSNGRIGIGTEAPISKLHVVDDIRSDDGFVITGTGRLEKKGTNDTHLWSTNNLEFGTNGANTKMILDTNGNLGIGKTNPSAKLDIHGNSFSSTNLILSANYNDRYRWRFNTIDRGNAIDMDFTASDGGDNQEQVLKLSRSTSGRPEFQLHNNALVANNGSVGIGTTNPTEKLEVRGSFKVNTNSSYSSIRLGQQANDAIIADNYDIANNTDINTYGAGYWFRVHDESLTHKYRDVMMLAENGNVGIGTKKPDQKLVVNGAVSFDYGNGSSHNGLRRSGIKTQYYNGITNGTGVIHEFTGTRGAIMSLTNDNVGIGTTDTQGFKLGVNGDIAATKVKVALYNNWPDYVFEDTYELPTLEEVEAHINEKGHLKNVPSAKEVAENGFFLEEMNAKLLQKIEELTLYTIAQEKEIKTIKSQKDADLQLVKEENKALAKRLAKLEALLLK